MPSTPHRFAWRARPPVAARAAGVLIALIAAGAWSCGGSAAPGSDEAAASAQAEPEAESPEPPDGGRGVFIRPKGKDVFRFEPWVSEEETNRLLRTLRRSAGGELHFTPGTYVVHQGFYLSSTPDVRISGSPDVRLEFAPPPPVMPLTTESLHEGDRLMKVDDVSTLHVGWSYQLYAPDRDSTRVLEFEIAGIEGDVIELKSPVTYMPMIQEIPPGSRVLEEINFFKVIACPGAVIEGFVMDGKGRGPVRGHTSYGGVYATGLNPKNQRPTVHGLTVRDCAFRGLKGRGVAAYGIAEVRVTNNSFHDIFAQAVEIDHFSSGYVANNLVDGAEVGVMINDAFETVVEGNVLLRCQLGVRFLRIFPQDWVNVGNVVRNNRIGYCDHGVVFNDNLNPEEGVKGNYVLGNHFLGITPFERVVNWTGNTVEGSTHD